jgi:CBS domain-containing protein
MHMIRQILELKNRAVLSISPEASVVEAITLMASHGVGALLVMDGDRLAGIVSERDYARKVLLMQRRSETTRVEEIMTASVITVSPGVRAHEGLEIMTERHIRHLPVVEAGKVIGVVSIGDLVKSVIESQKTLIADLERYVRG